MTEQQWWASTELWPMLEFLSDRASVRKLRLFSVACCRRALPWLKDSRQQDVVFGTERLADGLLTEAEFESIHKATLTFWHGLPTYKEVPWTTGNYIDAAVFQLGSGGGAGYAASYIARGLACLAGPDQSEVWRDAWKREVAVQCELLRDIFGSPFQPFLFDSDWLREQGLAARWARKQYLRGECKSLTAFAELLEQFGFHDAQAMAHCRQSGPHVRGCWVLDAMLGQEPAVRVGLVTDVDWQQCADPDPLLHILRGKGSVRQWRQFAVECCRRIDHLITDERSRSAVEVAARHADGLATDAQLAAAWADAEVVREAAAAEEYKTEAEEQFCTTPRWAASACRLYAAATASSAACRDPRVTDNETGTYDAENWQPSHHCASAAVRYDCIAKSGISQRDPNWREVIVMEDAVGFKEWRAQCDMLREIFSDWFGPVGDECGWLPNGFLRKENWSSNAVQWCRLPTALPVNAPSR